MKKDTPVGYNVAFRERPDEEDGFIERVSYDTEPKLTPLLYFSNKITD